LSEESHEPGGLPVIAIDDGNVYAAYQGCTTDADGECSQKLVFRMSNDGLRWTPAEIMWTAPEGQPDRGVWPLGVGFAGKALVLYDEGVDVYVGVRVT
jgi:hypothetical protein